MPAPHHAVSGCSCPLAIAATVIIIVIIIAVTVAIIVIAIIVTIAIAAAADHQKLHYVPYYLDIVSNPLEIYNLGIISTFSTLRR